MTSSEVSLWPKIRSPCSIFHGTQDLLERIGTQMKPDSSLMKQMFDSRIYQSTNELKEDRDWALAFDCCHAVP